jgi:uncharacterized RDD family membrane protein YckC
MPSAEHWDNLAANRAREERSVRGRSAPRNSEYSSVRRRFYAYVLEAILSILTLGIGWIIWSLLAWRRGQSPAKQVMGMYVVHDGKPASWLRMAAREILAKGGVGLVCGGVIYSARGLPALLSLLVTGIVFTMYYFWMVFDPENRALWDQPAGTHVVEERDDF